MHGVGRTVFSGNQVEEFQVEILGVLENIGPKESLILARLSGGPLEHTGVMQGMSGSPVYIDGNWPAPWPWRSRSPKIPSPASAPSRTWCAPPPSPTSAARRGAPNRARSGPRLDTTSPVSSRRRPQPPAETRMIDIATPLSFGGFSRATLDAFAPQLRALGLEPRQAITAGGRHPRPAWAIPPTCKPGSMISVQLMAGDLSVGADGTVTYIDGNRIYAFGHRFLDVGATALPFARAEVITLLPNVNTSFKIATAQGVDGHHLPGSQYGHLRRTRQARRHGAGRRSPFRAATAPVDTYQMQMVNDPLLSPLLLQMAVFSAIDATERTVGASSAPRHRRDRISERARPGHI